MHKFTQIITTVILDILIQVMFDKFVLFSYNGSLLGGPNLVRSRGEERNPGPAAPRGSKVLGSRSDLEPQQETIS